jgi:hypothetical protein
MYSKSSDKTTFSYHIKLGFMNQKKECFLLMWIVRTCLRGRCQTRSLVNGHLVW